MGLKNTAMKFFWSDEMEEQQEEYTRPRLLKSGHLNIMVRTPKSFADVREYADSLMNGSAIMVCFDYLNGVSYIINADVKKINDDLLLYAPEQVQVNKEEARTSSNVRSWLSK